jgi:hypothetical protein
MGPDGAGAGSRPHLAAVAATAAILAAAAGCPQGPPPVKLEPTSVPPAFIAVAQGQTMQSARFLTGSTLLLRVRDARSGLRVAKAAIGIHGPTLAGGQSGATFDLSFGPLAAAAYRVRVAAAGYVTKVQELAISGRSKAGQKTSDTQTEIMLDPGEAGITGRIVDAATGAGIAGARVLSGDNLAYSSADGAFRLAGLAPGSHALKFRKTGYQPLDAAGAQAGADLGAVAIATATVTVDFANATSVFSTQAASGVLRGLKDALLAAGAAVKDDDPAGATVHVLAAPGADVASKTDGLLGKVKGGDKLVVLGEWGGLAGYSPETVAALLGPAGLAIEPDLVRSAKHAGRPDWPLGTPVAPWPFPTGDVALFQPASVFAVAPAQAILRAAGGYRVASAPPRDPVLAAVAPYGDGLVVAVGDTSAWSDVNTTGAGPDLGFKENRTYVVNLILW